MHLFTLFTADLYSSTVQTVIGAQKLPTIICGVFLPSILTWIMKKWSDKSRTWDVLQGNLIEFSKLSMAWDIQKAKRDSLDYKNKKQMTIKCDVWIFTDLS